MPESSGAPGPVIAIDLGDVRIGVAVSDPERTLAIPLTTLAASDPWMAQLAELADDHGATLIVVGLPYSLSGDRGPRADEVQRQTDALAAAMSIPVRSHDERLSTVEAQRRLAEAGIRGPRQREVIDRTAAAVILESFLAIP